MDDLEEIKTKTLSLLQDLESDLPAQFPLDEYCAAISKYGRKRLKEALAREAELRYQAECILKEHGFRQNRFGKWIKED